MFIQKGKNMTTLKSASLYLLALLISGFCSTQAQEQAVETNSLKPGVWALEFGIGSNFTLVSFQGASISAKYHTSATNAWQAGITVNGNAQNGSSLQLPVLGDTITSGNSSVNSNNSENVSLKVQYLCYANSESIIHFYTGAGPIVGYSHSLTSQQSFNDNSSPSHNMWNIQNTSRTADTWSIGASGIVGAEYFPAKVFSLHAEYNVNLTYQQQKSESKMSTISNDGGANYYGSNGSGGSHGWTLGSGGVSFGLNVYF
jgi:hypothetical protein